MLPLPVVSSSPNTSSGSTCDTRVEPGGQYCPLCLANICTYSTVLKDPSTINISVTQIQSSDSSVTVYQYLSLDCQSNSIAFLYQNKTFGSVNWRLTIVFWKEFQEKTMIKCDPSYQKDTFFCLGDAVWVLLMVNGAGP